MKKSRKSYIAITLLIAVISLCSVSIFKFLKKPTQPYLTVVGPVAMKEGLGRLAAELINSLKDQVSTGFKPSNKKIKLEGTPKEIRKILKNTKLPIGKVVIYADYLGVGGLSFKKVIKGLKNSDNIRIAYSMFESSLIPPEWVVSLNLCFDAVAVPDKFLIDVYKNSGVTIPIFEIPLGLDLKTFLTAPLKRERKSPMVFANLGTAIPRKNQLKLIRAFHKAFGNSPDVRLRLNSKFGYPECIQAIKNEIHDFGITNIDFTQMEMEKDFYLKTFQDIDCYVSLSSGEGFSIQPREAMALGIPVIVTDNTGQSTICSSHLGYTVFSLSPIPAFYPEFKNQYGVFYDCETDDVVTALKEVYQNYDNYLQQGPSARAWVKQYSYEHLKTLYLELIRPKKVVLGHNNKVTPDYLLTDSKELCEKFSKLTGVPFEDKRKHEAY